MKVKRKNVLKSKRGITLIALVVTIIVLIILAAITINMLFGENGIITQARWADFVTEMSEVEEQIDLALQAKSLRISLGSSEDASLFDTKCDESELPSTLLAELESLGGSTSDLYKVSKTAYGEEIEEMNDIDENTYLYEATIKVAFKIKGINIYGTTIHSISGGEGKSSSSSTDSSTAETPKVAEMEVTYTYGYYEPDLNGFDPKNTYIVYYAEDGETYDASTTLEQYLSEGKPQTKTIDGATYTFHNYTTDTANSIWGNVITKANGIEAWWVWVPRYAYNTSMSSSNPIETAFITTDNYPIKPKSEGGGTYDTKVGEEGDWSNYIAHSGFTTTDTTTTTDSEGNETTVNKTNELKGIWYSKYEPSDVDVTTDEDIMDGTVEATCYAPNMVGYDINNTYIVTYDENGTEGTEKQYLLKNVLKSGYKASENGVLESGEVDLSKIPTGEVWYDYDEQIWRKYSNESKWNRSMVGMDTEIRVLHCGKWARNINSIYNNRK